MKRGYVKSGGFRLGHVTYDTVFVGDEAKRDARTDGNKERRKRLEGRKQQMGMVACASQDMFSNGPSDDSEDDTRPPRADLPSEA